MSAEKIYQQRASTLDEDDLSRIQLFYENWDGQTTLDLKFRYIKLFGFNLKSKEGKWYNLHHLLNIRRFKTELLPNYIYDIIEDHQIYPLRIFQSCTEWLAPNEVGRSDSARIIRSGILPFENDEDLTTSLQVASKLSTLLDNTILVYSGNKSVHCWVEIEIDNLDEYEIAYADRREEAEKEYRMKYYKGVQSQISQKLDKRISTDARRVIPVINSLNAITMRKVTQLDPNQVCTITPEELEKISTV